MSEPAKKLKTVAEHCAVVATHVDVPEGSGIACPQCERLDGAETELVWGDRSLFSTHPPMRRANCRVCSYSVVVPV